MEDIGRNVADSMRGWDLGGQLVRQGVMALALQPSSAVGGTWQEPLTQACGFSAVLIPQADVGGQRGLEQSLCCILWRGTRVSVLSAAVLPSVCLPALSTCVCMPCSYWGA